MTDLDSETSAAVGALTHRLANRDPEVDDEVFAREFMTALRGRGWRPTEARVMPAWSASKRGTGSEPPRDLLAQAKADCDAATAALRVKADHAARQDGAA